MREKIERFRDRRRAYSFLIDRDFVFEEPISNYRQVRELLRK
jgi:hypothetical protein